MRGSLNYAIEHLGESLKLVVVLGHSGCGAVTAAVDVFLDPAAYLSLVTKHSIRSLVDRLQVLVEASARRMAAAFGPDIPRHPRYREALIEVAVVIERGAGGAHAAAGDRRRREGRGAHRLRRLRDRGSDGLGAALRQR